MYKITSEDLKLALMQYYRFNYGYICTTEFRGADIIADTGKEIIEVEVKISKEDLIEGEKAKKIKHFLYERGKGKNRLHPNKFLFCVPDYLTEDALTWAKTLNSNYGVIQFNTKDFLRCLERNAFSWMNNNCYLTIIRSAKKLHEKYDPKLIWDIAKRVTSEATNLMTGRFLKQLRG